MFIFFLYAYIWIILRYLLLFKDYISFFVVTLFPLKRRLSRHRLSLVFLIFEEFQDFVKHLKPRVVRLVFLELNSTICFF